MSYSCTKCKKSFKEKRYLDQHISNRKTPCNKKYICTACRKVFDSQRHLDRHMKRVTPCAPDQVPVILENNVENRCQYCNKTYANKSSLTRHLKICNKDVSMKAIMKLLEENNRRLVEELRGGNTTTIINNNTLYMGNKLCVFGEEDFSLLNQNKVQAMFLEDATKFVPRLIRELHTNPELPQFHNVYYDTETKQAMVFTRVMINGVYVSTWQKKDMSEVSKELVKKAKRYPTCTPLAQNIKPNSADEHRYCQSMQFVTREYKPSDEDFNDIKQTLTNVSKNPGFFKMIEDTTYVSGTLPLIHLN